MVDELQGRLRAEDEERRLFSRLFLGVAQKYLQLRFHILESKGQSTFQAFDFEPPATPELLELREELWRQLFQFYDHPASQHKVLDIIHAYVSEGRRAYTSEIIEADAELVLPFLEDRLDPENYSHCVVVHGFLDLLERRHISFDASLREHFSSEVYTLSKLLVREPRERRSHDSREAYEQHRYERIRTYFSAYTADDYETFFEQCKEIQTSSINKNNERIHTFQVGWAIEDVFVAIAERSRVLFKTVLSRYLRLGDPLDLVQISRIVRHLVQTDGAEEALALLQRFNYRTRTRWWRSSSRKPGRTRDAASS